MQSIYRLTVCEYPVVMVHYQSKDTKITSHDRQYLKKMQETLRFTEQPNASAEVSGYWEIYYSKQQLNNMFLK